MICDNNFYSRFFKIPSLSEKFMALKPRDQNLFLRKCVSIVHCWAVCIAVVYLEFNPKKCAAGWQTFSEVWVGFLWTDLIVSFLTGTASAGYKL